MSPETWLAFEGIGYLFVALLVLALLALAFGRSFRRRAPGAEEILKRRYARGEITRQQYEVQLDELRR